MYFRNLHAPTHTLAPHTFRGILYSQCVTWLLSTSKSIISSQWTPNRYPLMQFNLHSVWRLSVLTVLRQLFDRTCAQKKKEVEIHSVVLQQQIENWCLVKLTNSWFIPGAWHPGRSEDFSKTKQKSRRNLYDMFSERISHFESEIQRSLVRSIKQDKNNLPDIIYELFCLFWATCMTEDKGSIVTCLWNYYFVCRLIKIFDKELVSIMGQ